MQELESRDDHRQIPEEELDRLKKSMAEVKTMFLETKLEMMGLKKIMLSVQLQIKTPASGRTEEKGRCVAKCRSLDTYYGLNYTHVALITLNLKLGRMIIFYILATRKRLEQVRTN